jgi:GGDEF domain-containing protein
MLSAGLKWLYSLVVPGGLLLLAAIGFLRPTGLPPWTHPLVVGLSYFVFGFGVLFGWYLDRGRVVFSILVLALADVLVLFFASGEAAATESGRIVFNTVAVLLPLNFLAFGLISDRGAFSRSSVVSLGFVLFQIVAVVWSGSAWQRDVATALEVAYIAPALTAWTRIPQPAILTFAAALALQLFRFGVFRNSIESGFAWSLVAAFLALHGTRYEWAPTNYFAAAGFILLVALVETSYKKTYRDESTGLRARLAFDQVLIGLRKGDSAAIVEIDDLRLINDRYGRSVAERVLHLVATKIAAVPGGGNAFRYSDETFAVIFSGTSAMETLGHLDAVRRRIEMARVPLRGRSRFRQFFHQSNGSSSNVEELPVTVSIGVAERTNLKYGPDHVIKAAYKAMYGVKQSGGNQVKKCA